MKLIKVNGIHCEKCIERISNALRAAEIIFQISLEKKELMIDGCEQCVEKAMEILEELGFEGV
jgi:hypothetical protein